MWHYLASLIADVLVCGWEPLVIYFYITIPLYPSDLFIILFSRLFLIFCLIICHVVSIGIHH